MALVTEAETCAQHHDQRGLYKIINKLAPKQYRRRMQLREESGELLSPSQQQDVLVRHFCDRFSATTEAELALLNTVWPVTASSFLEPAALEQALLAAPLLKSTPPGHPPSAARRLVADLVAPWTCNHASRNSCSMVTLAYPVSGQELI